MADRRKLLEAEEVDIPPPYQYGGSAGPSGSLYPSVYQPYQQTQPGLSSGPQGPLADYSVDNTTPPPAYVSALARFPENPKWTNPRMLVFFLVNTLAAFLSCAWSVHMFVNIEHEWSVSTEHLETYGPTIGRVLLVSLVLGISFSILFQRMSRTCPLHFLYASFWATMGFMLLTAIPFFAHLQTAWIGLFPILGVICGVWWFMARRDLLEFTAMAMRVGTHALSKHPVYWAVFAMMVVQWCFSIFFLTAVIGTSLYASSGTEQDDRTSYHVLAFWQAASMLWLLEVTKNVIHTTVAGTIGRYYFSLGQSPRAGRKSFAYACTKGLGAISFGSLLITIVRILRSLVENRNDREDNIGVVVLRCVAWCLLSCLEGMLEAFNYFAFVHVAIYGVDYLTAGKGVMDMLKRTGIDALMNNTLTGMATTMALMSSGLVSGLLAMLVVYTSPLNVPANENIMAGAYAGSFFSGFLVTGTAVGLVMGTLESAVSALFVCYTDDPRIMQEIDPEFNQQIIQGVALAKQKQQQSN
eukprot:comp22961_c0_seq1/m.36456 comp22961_c0_seq1/g.36456  ORF comp22961_c0_seq1/g.36456 comp22961_c0_seq1/m.36456 type:complete len:525 (-) comp22961_c0_seq1:456-2030(-)